MLSFASINLPSFVRAFNNSDNGYETGQQTEFSSFVALADPIPLPDLETLPAPEVPKIPEQATHKSNPHSSFWRRAMDEEMESMEASKRSLGAHRAASRMQGSGRTMGLHP